MRDLWEKMKCFFQNYWRFIAIGVGLMALIEIITATSFPILHDAELDNPIVTLSMDQAQITNYEEKDGVFTPTGADPQICFSSIDKEISNLIIRLEEPTNDNVQYVLYYPGMNGGLSEENKVVLIVPKGQSVVYFEFPYAEYSILRLDVDGVFHPREIVAGSGAIKKNLEWNHLRLSPLRMLVLSVFFTVVLLYLWDKKDTIKNKFLGCIYWLQNHTKKSLIFLLSATSFLLFTYVAVYYYSESRAVSYQTPLFWFVVIMMGCVGLFYLFRKSIADKPERLFAILALSTGLLLCIFAPLMTGVAWDDQTHYIRSVAYLSEVTEADIVMENYAYQNSLNTSFSVEVTKERSDYLNETYQNRQLVYQNSYYDSADLTVYKGIGYLPVAIGIVLGRALQLPFSVVFVLGKICNLITYVLLIYLAIRRLKTGKMILASIALLPICVFLASCYSYDNWVTAWLTLGLAYFFAELQEPEKPLAAKDLAVILGSLFIGLGPKAVYVPVVAILFLLPKSKFSSPKKYKQYLVCVSTIIVVALMTFILPILMGNAPTDSRGGSTVNGGEQIAFILFHPLSYAKTLLTFLGRYVSSFELLTDFAYLGIISGTASLILLVVVAVTDKDRLDKYTTNRKCRIWIGLCVFAALCLVATSLYIAFTPVGANTIAGCQQRYKLPLFFPIFYILGSPKMINRIDRRKYNLTVFAISGVILYWEIFTRCISRYFL